MTMDLKRGALNHPRSLTSKKVRLLYQKKIERACTPEERGILKDIIYKLLPVYLPSQTPDEDTTEQLEINKHQIEINENQREITVHQGETTCDKKSDNNISDEDVDKVEDNDFDYPSGVRRKLNRFRGQRDSPEDTDDHSEVIAPDNVSRSVSPVSNCNSSTGIPCVEDQESLIVHSECESENKLKRKVRKCKLVQKILPTAGRFEGQRDSFSERNASAGDQNTLEGPSISSIKNYNTPKDYVERNIISKLLSETGVKLKPCSVRVYDIQTDPSSATSDDLLYWRDGPRIPYSKFRTIIKHQQSLIKQNISDLDSLDDFDKCTAPSKNFNQQKRLQRKETNSNSSDSREILPRSSLETEKAQTKKSKSPLTGRNLAKMKQKIIQKRKAVDSSDETDSYDDSVAKNRKVTSRKRQKVAEDSDSDLTPRKGGKKSKKSRPDINSDSDNDFVSLKAQTNNNKAKTISKSKKGETERIEVETESDTNSESTPLKPREKKNKKLSIERSYKTNSSETSAAKKSVKKSGGKSGKLSDDHIVESDNSSQEVKDSENSSDSDDTLPPQKTTTPSKNFARNAQKKRVNDKKSEKALNDNEEVSDNSSNLMNVSSNSDSDELPSLKITTTKKGTSSAKRVPKRKGNSARESNSDSEIKNDKRTPKTRKKMSKDFGNSDLSSSESEDKEKPLKVESVSKSKWTPPGGDGRKGRQSSLKKSNTNSASEKSDSDDEKLNNVSMEVEDSVKSEEENDENRDKSKDDNQADKVVKNKRKKTYSDSDDTLPPQKTTTPSKNFARNAQKKRVNDKKSEKALNDNEEVSDNSSNLMNVSSNSDSDELPSLKITTTKKGTSSAKRVPKRKGNLARESNSDSEIKNDKRTPKTRKKMSKDFGNSDLSSSESEDNEKPLKVESVSKSKWTPPGGDGRKGRQSSLKKSNTNSESEKSDSDDEKFNNVSMEVEDSVKSEEENDENRDKSKDDNQADKVVKNKRKKTYSDSDDTLPPQKTTTPSKIFERNAQKKRVNDKKSEKALNHSKEVSDNSSNLLNVSSNSDSDELPSLKITTTKKGTSSAKRVPKRKGNSTRESNSDSEIKNDKRTPKTRKKISKDFGNSDLSSSESEDNEKPLKVESVSKSKQTPTGGDGRKGRQSSLKKSNTNSASEKSDSDDEKCNNVSVESVDESDTDDQPLKESSSLKKARSSPTKQKASSSDNDTISLSESELQSIKPDKHKGKVKKSVASSSDNDTISLSESELQSIKPDEPKGKVKKSVKTKKQSLKSAESSDEDSDDEDLASKKKKHKQVSEKPQPNKHTKALTHLKKVCQAAGVSFVHRCKGCDSDRDKVDSIQSYLEELGMKGHPTLKKGKQLRLQREVAELDTSNIISSKEGRTRRRGADDFLTTTRQKSSPRAFTPVKKRLSRIKDIIDSEGSSD